MPPSPAVPTGRRRPTRRGLLLGGAGLGAGGLAGLLVAGCSDGAGARGSTPAGAGTSSAGVSTTEAADAGDERLLSSVVEAIADTRALVRAVRRRHQELSTSLAPLGAAHAAHGRALGGLPAASRAPAPARSASAALAQVVAAEQDLTDQVSRAVVAARSGPLAATLASVAASLTQHLTALATASAAGAPAEGAP